MLITLSKIITLFLLLNVIVNWTTATLLSRLVSADMQQTLVISNSLTRGDFLNTYTLRALTFNTRHYFSMIRYNVRWFFILKIWPIIIIWNCQLNKWFVSVFTLTNVKWDRWVTRKRVQNAIWQQRIILYIMRVSY